MPNIDLNDVIARIGSLNIDEISQVQATVTARSKYLREQATRENKATLAPGDRVVTGKLTPKYLAGRTGVVAPTDTTRRAKDVTIIVDEDSRYLLGRYGNPATGELNVPAGALRKV